MSAAQFAARLVVLHVLSAPILNVAARLREVVAKLQPVCAVEPGASWVKSGVSMPVVLRPKWMNGISPEVQLRGG
jgi:hypothetical protein